jgi:hypothetical protein
MKMPQRPPNFAELMARFATDGSILKLLNGIRSSSFDGKYLHWDQIRHRTPPAGLNHEEWWFGLKARREASSSILPLSGADGLPFRYASDPLTFYLHQVDMGAAGSIQQNEPVTNAETKDFYLVRSLVEESITSSQLEGASTTRKWQSK